jgi:hypothetical protein
MVQDREKEISAFGGSADLVVPQFYFIACGNQVVAEGDRIRLRNWKFRTALRTTIEIK